MQAMQNVDLKKLLSKFNHVLKITPNSTIPTWAQEIPTYTKLLIYFFCQAIRRKHIKG